MIPETYTTENFIVVAEALLKIGSYFWPVIFVAVCFFIWESIEDSKRKV